MSEVQKQSILNINKIYLNTFTSVVVCYNAKY